MSVKIFERGLILAPIKSLLRSPWFFVFLWIGLTALLALEINISPLSLLFGATTVLLYTHILYGGYFLFKREDRINFRVVFLILAIYSCSALLAQSLGRPLLWLCRLQLVFLCAMAFHLYYKARLAEEYLKEFCNYKLYVELTAFLFCFLGLAISYFFPSLAVAFAILIFIVVVKSNLAIFFKKRLYTIRYQPTDIPPEPLVSIVVIAYNEERYIGRLLESIKRQDYRKFEVIVVDDHSADNTVAVASGFASEFPLKVVQKEVRGISRSRNYGATFARGELILFLDGDVILAENFISENLKTFKKERLSIAAFDFISETDSVLDKWITGFFGWILFRLFVLIRLAQPQKEMVEKETITL